MEAWRRQALEMFPELREGLRDPSALASFDALWARLVAMVPDASRAGDEDLLRRLYAYAEWCHRERGGA
jgi:hypothetical protein